MINSELLNDSDRLNTINHEMKAYGIVSEQQNSLEDYLIHVIEMPVESVGIVYMELSASQNSIIAKVMCRIIEK